ncbi:HAD-IA family hydrolase [Vannielia litorea]|uniref:HAD-IA family hydrolase n=1 Tax=Vannielia litorea TaxID=1217970 RepID=UPI001C96568E|nr:HAD-IA family hydrolase [Vannielia litorea]MBY6049664.1 HAD-IA family hydrolase [Vannielia litorea]MBY6077078.1 HAD-IA family hydrolase [Vannielia litorea]
MSQLRCIIFDVDGTLIDSQNEIVAAMTAGFAATGRTAPPRAQVLSIVGLSLEVGIARLCPEADAGEVATMTAAYKDSFVEIRKTSPAAIFYPGMRELLDELAQTPENLLCVATGKSRRGLDALVKSSGLEGMFISEQVSDHHPSKPHPSMLEAALRETGCEAHQAVMIGDTSYDMDMARNAGITGIGVSWGYHAPAALAEAGAAEVVQDAAALGRAIFRATGG